MTAIAKSTVNVINITQSFAIQLSETALQVYVPRSADLIINGNGYTIAGNDQGRILWLINSASHTLIVNNLSFTAEFNDCNFTDKPRKR